ncbi:HEPN domain-containing protein [Thermoflexus sp.]
MIPPRYPDWLARGLRDLKAARSMPDGGFYERAAVQAHQTAERI